MDEEMKQRLVYLRLKGLLDNWDHYFKQARSKEYSHTGFLKYVIEQEYNIKKENSTRLRMKRAKIPRHLVLVSDIDWPAGELPALRWMLTPLDGAF